MSRYESALARSFRCRAYRIDVNALPEQRKAAMAGNRAALGAYGGVMARYATEAVDPA
jgi:hypothetical protein